MAGVLNHQGSYHQTQQTQQRNFFASSPLEFLLQFLVAMMGIDVFGMNNAHQQQQQTRQVQQPQQQSSSFRRVWSEVFTIYFF